MDKSTEREAVTAWNGISKAVESKKEQRDGKSVAAKERAILKKQFRKEALAIRDILTPGQRRDYSGRIIRNLLSLPCYQEADAILTYISFRSEVDTFPLLEQAFADGKAVFAPKVMGKEMAFYRIFSGDDLAAGYQGILEPAGGQLFEMWINDWISQRKKCQQEPLLMTREAVTPEDKVTSILICLPGAAFDRSCHRIGYGGGFYDRYLSRVLRDRNSTGAETFLQTEADAAAHPRTDAACPRMKYVTAALSYNCQIFEEIPWETHDIRPEQIITETEIISRKGEAQCQNLSVN